MLSLLFAHAGEDHSSTAESASHFLSHPLNALLVWVLITVFLFAIVPRLQSAISTATLFLVFGAFNLFYGLFLYNKAPEVGAIILTVGFASTLWTVLSGLGLAEVNKKGIKNGRSKKRKR